MSKKKADDALAAMKRAAAEGRGQMDPRVAQAVGEEKERREHIAGMAKMMFILLRPGEQMTFQFVNKSNSRLTVPGHLSADGRPVGVLTVSKPLVSTGVGVMIDVKEEMGIDPMTGEDIEMAGPSTNGPRLVED